MQMVAGIGADDPGSILRKANDLFRAGLNFFAAIILVSYFKFKSICTDLFPGYDTPFFQNKTFPYSYNNSTVFRTVSRCRQITFVRNNIFECNERPLMVYIDQDLSR